jgi:hypothetical protein
MLTNIALIHFPLTVGKIWDTSFDFLSFRAISLLALMVEMAN